MKYLKYLLLLSLLLIMSCDYNTVEPDDYVGKIYGVVYDFDSELLLENCNVKLDPTVASTITTDRGAFNFTNVRVDEYDIIIEKTGYRLYKGKVIVEYDKKTTIYIPLKKNSPLR